MIRDFLEIFEEATREVEATKKPTLHLVVPWFFRLVATCEVSETDNVLIANMKTIGREYFQTNISKHITKYHNMAAFLCPTLKSLRMYHPQKKAEIIVEIRSFLDENFPPTPSQNTTHIAHRPIACNASSTSKALSMFEEAEEDASHHNISDEIQSYMECKVQSNVDVLTWWYENKNRYPRLTNLTCFVLAIPASSASAERAFSKAGYTVQFRPNMNASSLDDVLVLNSNKDCQ